MTRTSNARRLVTNAGQVQFALVAGSVAVAPLLRWKQAADAFSLPKFLLIVLMASAVVGTEISLRNQVEGRRLLNHSYARVAALFLLALAVATLFSDAPLRSLLGPYRRWNGLLLHLAAATLAVVVAVRLSDRQAISLLRLYAATAVAVALHGLLQWFGWVDTSVIATGSTVVAALGNSNFVAAYLGMSLPLLVAAVVGQERRRGAWRAGAATGLAVGVAVLFASRALQGPAVAAASLLASAVVYTWSRRPRVSAVVAGGGLLGGALLAAGIVGIGPFAMLSAERSMVLRRYYWDAALSMFGDHPVVGVGPGRYVRHFREVRPTDVALDMPAGIDVDGAHNVILDTFASAGLLGGLVLLALLLVVVRAAFRVARGTPDLWRAGAVGLWAGWIVQALVSVETPIMVLTGWVSGALVVRLGAAGERVEVGSRGRKRQPKLARQRAQARRAILGAAACALPVAVIAAIWLSADLAAGRARAARLQSRTDIAAVSAQSAARRSPWQPEYFIALGEAADATGRPSASVEAYSDAVRLDGRDLRAWLGLAQATRSATGPAESVDAYLMALRLEPNLPELHVEAAVVALEAEQLSLANEWAVGAVQLRDDLADAWAVLGRVRHALGDAEGALDALRRAEVLGTTDDEALALLEVLEG